MTIYFYKLSGKYSAFSNFSPYGIWIECYWWPTVEHYYQASKFNDKDYRNLIRNAETPRIAKTLGNNKNIPLKSDWDSIKDSIMEQAIYIKFLSYTELKHLLLNTGDAEIVEDSPTDYYWGCGADRTGLNKLGKILMKVRKTILEDHSR